MPPRRTDTIVEALERFASARSAIEKQQQRELEDLAFQTPEGMWPEAVRASREATTIGNIPVPARPMLSVASLDEPIQLVLNQASRAHLGVEISPESEDANDDTAEVLQDLYRDIETSSRADIARLWAFDRAVKAGRGC